MYIYIYIYIYIINYAIGRLYEKAVRWDLYIQMKKPLLCRITYCELLFQCYLLVSGNFDRFFL